MDGSEWEKAWYTWATLEGQCMGQSEQVGQGRRRGWKGEQRAGTWAWSAMEMTGFYPNSNRRPFNGFNKAGE